MFSFSVSFLPGATDRAAEPFLSGIHCTCLGIVGKNSYVADGLYSQPESFIRATPRDEADFTRDCRNRSGSLFQAEHKAT
jgi:hypothetical protein